jgi:hypothetical protein
MLAAWRERSTDPLLDADESKYSRQRKRHLAAAHSSAPGQQIKGRCIRLLVYTGIAVLGCTLFARWLWESSQRQQIGRSNPLTGALHAWLAPNDRASSLTHLTVPNSMHVSAQDSSGRRRSIDTAAAAFTGSSRMAQAEQRGRLKIAIISNAVTWPEDQTAAAAAEVSLRRYSEFLANKQCYAELHGYDLIVDSRNHVARQGFFVNPKTGERGDTNVHFN